MFRFIPACAGSRHRCHRGSSVHPVHPRVRGEQSTSCSSASPCRGSSPRARGAGKRLGKNNDVSRFIPACAGSSSAEQTIRLQVPVHPRVRGEQSPSRTGSTRCTGSSPRARGAGCYGTKLTDRLRFIPACAGSRTEGKCPRPYRPVHPRVRGEQQIVRHRALTICGSSPRARGAAGMARRPAARIRFIPACAGSSDGWLVEEVSRAVHPRVRGEQDQLVDIAPVNVGSSPRARGAVHSRPDERPTKRFIPACAGSRLPSANPPTKGPVHPRVRGEQAWQVSQVKLALGSSPRARGAGGLQITNGLPPRFIPACAGSSRVA